MIFILLTIVSIKEIELGQNHSLLQVAFLRMASKVYFMALVALFTSSGCVTAQKSTMSTLDLCGSSNVTCSECFNLLVFEVSRTSEHQYNLTQAFFPPTTSTPVYITVIYYYEDDSGHVVNDSTWFWSTSTYYLYEPPAVLQYTSLFFADPEFRSTNLSLTLPMSCLGSGNKEMQLLTQRVSRNAL